MKKIKLLVLLTIMLIPLNIFAYEKEEYIYTNIDTQGKEVEKVINNEEIIFSFRSGAAVGIGSGPEPATGPNHP